MTINFVKKRYICITISLVICLLSMLLILQKKLSLGLEFCGGTELEIKIIKNIKINEIKQKLSKIKNIKINYYGSDKTIKIKTKNIKNNTTEIKKLLNELGQENLKIINSTYIGAEINKDTIKQSIIAIILAIISMTTYLAIRFNAIFATSAMITLFHDILIILGIISVLNIEVDLTILAAIFTIFGYSVNDTIIIFDRIRENIKISKKDTSLIDIINISINKTLSRTISTSFSTILVTFTLLLFSGENLYWFSFILTAGIIIGTYSSIYISAIPLTFIKNKNYSK